MAIRKTFREGFDFATILPKTEREKFIDIAKIFAVILMILTHVIAVVYDYNRGTDSLVYWIGLIGGIGSFSSFLFLSGINYYYSSVREFESKSEDYTLLQKKLFYRTIQLSIVYILLAALYFVVFNRLYDPTYSSGSILRNIYNTFTVGPLPEFSEYLIAIALFTFAGIFFANFYRWVSKTQWRALLLGTFLFFVGYVAFNLVSLPARLNTLASIFFGKTFEGLRIHSFPILQYSVIFLLGLWFGHYVKNHLHTRVRVRAVSIFFVFSLILTILSFVGYSIYKIDLFYPLPVEGRFPPSIGFIALSLLITSIIIILSIGTAKLLRDQLSRLTEFIGKNALGILVWHLLILFAYKYFQDTGRINYKALNILEILGITAVVVLLSLFITLIYNYLVYTLIEIKFKKQFDFFVHFLAPLFLLILSAVSVTYLVFSRVTAYAQGVGDNIENFERVIALPKQDPFWANDDYEYKRQIVLSNETSSVVLETSFVAVQFDHAKAISEKKALDISGNDIRVIYWDKLENTFIELPFTIQNPNTASTVITFKLRKDIGVKQSNEDYFLYYGNTFVKDYPKLEQTIGITASNINSNLSNEMVHRLDLTINKEWLLLTPETKSLKDNLLGNITIPSDISNGKYYLSYDVLNSKDQLITSKEVPLNNSNKYTIEPGIAGLGPSIYKLQVRLINFDKNLEVLTSYKTPFRISYPLYVTWSFDWDGWGVAPFGLYAIDRTANTYNMPITQLFNPRIYLAPEKQTSFTEVVQPEQAKSLTDWVLNRQNRYGDEIGMHMHMFADMVKEAGVNPRPGTVVGAMYGDAKTSDFTQAELEQIFKWGFDQFEEHGLPKPISYRSGGWFSGPNVLKAAENAGFLIDTSARTGGRINPQLNYSTQLPWTLIQPTTYPYLPNVSNIEKWESPRLGLWEFPDNGADSYWFTAEDLISRFQQNMPGEAGVLTHPQVLTYLTHPHWYTQIDEPKVNKLFQYIGNYKYDINSGPVIYTTLEKAYNEWDKTNDINGN